MTSSPFEPVCTRGRVLLVESSSVFREMQCLLLQRAGYGVTVCDQSDTALAEGGKQPLDVAVLTSDVPGLDRPEFIGELRRQRPGIGLIFVTTSVTMALTRELMARGVSAVLQRPVNPAILMQTIDEAMGLTIRPGAPRYSELPIPAPSGAPSVSPFVSTKSVDQTSAAPFISRSVAPFPPIGSIAPFRPESASPFAPRPYSTGSGFSASPFRSVSPSPFGVYAAR
jgi:CheY-like chemotaxis protein